MPKSNAASAPHSWDLDHWPSAVWPGNRERASWVLRAYRNELLYHRALTRIGKRLVVLGAGYEKFLAARMKNVEGFASNNPDCGRTDHKRPRALVEEAA